MYELGYMLRNFGRAAFEEARVFFLLARINSSRLFTFSEQQVLIPHLSSYFTASWRTWSDSPQHVSRSTSQDGSCRQEVSWLTCAVPKLHSNQTLQFVGTRMDSSPTPSFFLLPTLVSTFSPSRRSLDSVVFPSPVRFSVQAL